jgi:hypothetical protein
VGALAATLFFRQLWIVLSAPLEQRVTAAYLLLLVLVLAWIAAPLSMQPSFHARFLSLYPVTRAQKAAFAVLCRLQNLPTLVLLAASLLTLLSLFGMSHPLLAVAQAAVLLTLAAIAGLVLSLALSALLQRGRIRQQGCPRVRRVAVIACLSRRLPLLAKDLRSFARTLDPSLALFCMAGVAITEYLGAWMTPLKTTLPLLLTATLLLSLVLNPFGLESQPERSRYRLLPAPFWKLLLQKHCALATVFLAASIPLAISISVRMSLPEICASAVQFGLVLMSWLLTGLILMRLPSSQRLRIAFGSLSGSNMPVSLAIQSLFWLSVEPVAQVFAIRAAGPLFAPFVPPVFLMFLVAVYVVLIRQQRWLGQDVCAR